MGRSACTRGRSAGPRTGGRTVSSFEVRSERSKIDVFYAGKGIAQRLAGSTVPKTNVCPSIHTCSEALAHRETELTLTHQPSRRLASSIWKKKLHQISAGLPPRAMWGVSSVSRLASLAPPLEAKAAPLAPPVRASPLRTRWCRVAPDPPCEKARQQVESGENHGQRRAWQTNLRRGIRCKSREIEPCKLGSMPGCTCLARQQQLSRVVVEALRAEGREVAT